MTSPSKEVIVFGAVVMRFLVPVAFFAVSFWPDLGLFWFALSAFPVYPYAVTVLAALWAVVLCLLLPLPVRTFRTVSTVLVAAAFFVGTYSAWNAGYLPAITTQILIIYAIVFFGITLGWLMISIRFWRFIHSIVAVEDQHE